MQRFLTFPFENRFKYSSLHSLFKYLPDNDGDDANVFPYFFQTYHTNDFQNHFQSTVHPFSWWFQSENGTCNRGKVTPSSSHPARSCSRIWHVRQTHTRPRAQDVSFLVRELASRARHSCNIELILLNHLRVGPWGKSSALLCAATG